MNLSDVLNDIYHHLVPDFAHCHFHDTDIHHFFDSLVAVDDRFTQFNVLFHQFIEFYRYAEICFIMERRDNSDGWYEMAYRYLQSAQYELAIILNQHFAIHFVVAPR